MVLVLTTPGTSLSRLLRIIPGVVFALPLVEGGLFGRLVGRCLVRKKIVRLLLQCLCLFFLLGFGLLFARNMDILILVLLPLLLLLLCFFIDFCSSFLFRQELLALRILFRSFIQSFYLCFSSEYSLYPLVHEVILNVIDHLVFLETRNRQINLHLQLLIL